MGFSKTIRFDMSSARTHEDAVALIYDLEGFSKFVNQPDAHTYVPRFFNHVSKAVEIVICGGRPYWTDEDGTYTALPPPTHQKYLGDGALYIWVATKAHPFTLRFKRELLNRLRTLARGFAAVEKSSSERVPVALRPRRIRFGISEGRVHELARTDVKASHEFAGICINLASRLQSYCPGISLLTSAKLGLNPNQRSTWDYVRVVATKIKGFPPEPVLVDQAEYNSLRPKVRSKYFATE